MASNYEDVLKSINKALTEQDFIKAYQIADDNMFEYGGLPEFDVLTGFAAYGSEQYQEAVFAFERVVLERPNSFIGRFYLAQCYRELNNLAAAKKELNFLLSKSLPEEQKSKAANLLNRIERQEINKKRSWHQYVALGMSIDNNVNSGSSLETINIPNLGEIQLFDSAKQVNDISYSVNYNGRYQHPIT
jgi:tetratricopeptide (TPR) repeat protein